MEESVKAWERFVNTIEHKKGDYVPVVLIGTPRFYASMTGVKLFECFHDPCKMIDMQLQAFKKFPDITFIPGCWPDYGTALFSAWGGRISWSPNSTPSVKEKYLKSAQDIMDFELPNPETDGFMPWHLETLRLFVKRKGEFGDNLNFIHSNGPGELATYLWGLENFLEGTYCESDLMKQLLGKVTETIIAWLTAQSQILENARGMLITDDIAGLVSPEMYKEFLLPLHRHIGEKFKNMIYVFHCDTKADHILQFLPEIGIDVFNLGPTTDLAQAKNKIGKQICLMGNVDPVSILQNGSVTDVKMSAEKCLKEAMDGRRFLLSAGGGLNENTPEENIGALVEIAKSCYI
jgi:uroporphyrinogen decarboxylase